MKIITLNLPDNLKRKLLPLVLLFLFAFFTTNIHAVSKQNLLIETNRVWINVTDSQGAFSQTLMGYRADATDGVDHFLDGLYMNDGAIALASLIDNVRYAIQFRGLPLSPTSAVPLSFSASYNGSYTFAIDHADGFFASPSFAVYIHDTLTNTYNNLKTGSYTFSCNAGIYNDRFELTYSRPLGALETNQNTFTAASLNIYQNEGNITINAGNTLLKNFALYSITGQILYQNNELNANLAIINPILISHQPLVIKVTTQDGVVVSKKWLYL